MIFISNTERVCIIIVHLACMGVMEGIAGSEAPMAVMAAMEAWEAVTEASAAAMEEDMVTNIARDNHVKID